MTHHADFLVAFLAQSAFVLVSVAFAIACILALRAREVWQQVQVLMLNISGFQAGRSDGLSGVLDQEQQLLRCAYLVSRTGDIAHAEQKLRELERLIPVIRAKLLARRVNPA